MDFDDYNDFDPGVRIISLHFSTKQVEINVDQINTANLALIFSVNAATVWLQDRIGNKIYIPDSSGNFDIARHSSNVHGVTVNGVHLSSAVTGTATQNVSAAVSSTTLSSTATVTPSGSRPPFFQSVSSRKNKVKVKFVRSDITYSGNGRPNFTNIDVMFVDLTEDNADLNSMLALVRNEFGPNFTIVGNNGLQIKDSPATRGML